MTTEQAAPSSTAVICQNRAAANRQVIAGQPWRAVKGEDPQDEALHDLSKQIVG
jgi:hypothetical protein